MKFTIIPNRRFVHLSRLRRTIRRPKHPHRRLIINHKNILARRTSWRSLEPIESIFHNRESGRRALRLLSDLSNSIFDCFGFYWTETVFG